MIRWFLGIPERIKTRLTEEEKFNVLRHELWERQDRQKVERNRKLDIIIDRLLEDA